MVAQSSSQPSDTLTAVDSFIVERRHFPHWAVGAPISKVAVFPGVMQFEPWEDASGGWRFILGLNVMRRVDFSFGGPVTSAAASTGPNAGVFYFTGLPNLPADTIYLHPQLFGLPSEHGLWWSEQTGNQLWPTSLGPLRECKNIGPDMARLASAAQDHEGVTMQGGSHWYFAKVLYDQVPMGSIVEGLSIRTNDGDLRDLADSIYQARILQPLAVADSLLDTPESYDRVWQTVGCKPDIVLDGQ